MTTRICTLHNQEWCLRRECNAQMFPLLSKVTRHKPQTAAQLDAEWAARKPELDAIDADSDRFSGLEPTPYEKRKSAEDARRLGPEQAAKNTINREAWHGKKAK